MSNLKKRLSPIKKTIEYYAKELLPNVFKKDWQFNQRIKKRNRVFWTDPHASTVRFTVMDASDPIEKWKDVNNWQRKLSTKSNSRQFAIMHNCRVPELYWKGRDASTLDLNSLPNNYVIRPIKGWGSGLVFLMENFVNLMNGKTYSNEDLKKVLEKALSENSKLEFLIEEFLKTEGGVYRIPDDYKFYMFNGEIAAIQVINRLGASKGYTTCYNENWEIMKSVNTYYPEGTFQNPPKCLKELIEKAKQLSKAYEIFVRIDLYATDRGAVFGEFTPTPFMGKDFTPEANRYFIKYWDKYCKGKI